MNKKISLGAAITFTIIMMALTFCITVIFALSFFNDTMHNIKERENLYKKIAEIDRKVRDKYYGVIDENVLQSAQAAGYMNGIGDPFSAYMTQEQYAAYLQTVEGKYVGIGIVPQKAQDGFMLVGEVFPDSPASIAGMQAGDLIVKIDEVDVTEETYDEMEKSLRGDAGTKITLTIRRGEEEEELEDQDLQLTRRQVEIPTVYTRLFGEVGYLKITSFSVATSDQFNREAATLINNGVKALIFDLRGNTGGDMRACAETLDTLIGQGDIVSAIYRDGKKEVLYSSASGELSLPIVILTNENTAEAAEIFAQVLRDYNKGKTVGAKTAGIGSVQDVIKLTDGSAIRLTIAHYSTGSGVEIDGVGLMPDYEVSALAGDLPTMEEIDENTDPQFKKALELALSSIKVGESISAESEDTTAE